MAKEGLQIDLDANWDKIKPGITAMKYRFQAHQNDHNI